LKKKLVKLFYQGKNYLKLMGKDLLLMVLKVIEEEIQLLFKILLININKINLRKKKGEFYMNLPIKI
jgi:hypothetical protein